MDRVLRNCKELSKSYELEDINRAKAASLRRKLFGLLKAAEAEEDGGKKAVELFWLQAYYNPICAMRKRGDVGLLNNMVDIFAGEIFSYISSSTRNIAEYYIMLGDLMRYVQSPLSTVHYKKAIEANPELGKPFNQFGLEEKGIKAVRFYLLALAAKTPFKSALNNLKRALDEAGSSNKLLSQAINIIKLLILNKSQSNLQKELNNFLDVVEQLEEEDSFSNEYLPLISDAIVIAHKISPEQLGDDYFTAPIQCLCEYFLLLLSQNKGDSDLDEDVQVGARRRKLSSSSGSENESGSEEEKPSTSKIVQHSDLWAISLSIEWLIEITTRLATFDRAIIPVPASIKASLDKLTEKLIDRLNRLVKDIPFKSEENYAEETEWLLNGPSHEGQSVNFDYETAKRQLAYWVEQLLACKETDIEFSKYFRTKKNESSARKQLGLFRLDKVFKKAVTDDWIPIFVVLDYSVLEKKLYLVKSIINERKCIPIVPSFVLSELDKMKSTGPNIRNSMRFIEKHQSKGELRIQKCDSYGECVQELSKNAESAKTSCALLTTQIEKFAELIAEDLVVYQIETFASRLKSNN